MNRYGQQLMAWGPLDAPQLFTGAPLSFELRNELSKHLIQDGVGDFLAASLHSEKADFSFEAIVTVETTDFLDLSGGAAIAISGLEKGTALVRRAVESWRLETEKRASVSGTYYPDMVLGAGVMVTQGLSAFTPSQEGLESLFPLQKVIYGTHGLTHAAGVIHALTIEQQLNIDEDEPSPDGKILGAVSNGYQRTISLEILAKAAIPEVKSVLSIGGSPAHGNNYRITGADKMYRTKKGMMYKVDAMWIPGFVA